MRSPHINWYRALEKKLGVPHINEYDDKSSFLYQFRLTKTKGGKAETERERKRERERKASMYSLKTRNPHTTTPPIIS